MMITTFLSRVNLKAENSEFTLLLCQRVLSVIISWEAERSFIVGGCIAGIDVILVHASANAGSPRAE